MTPPPDEFTRTAPEHVPTTGLHGRITYTDLASVYCMATRARVAKVVEWTFTMDLPVPGGAPIGIPGP